MPAPPLRSGAGGVVSVEPREIAVTYRVGGSTGFKLEDADRARSAFLEVLAYLRRRHPDVSFRCFGEEDARLAWFHLFQDAAEEDALMRVRQPTKYFAVVKSYPPLGRPQKNY